MYTSPTSTKGKALNFFFVFLAAMLACVAALLIVKQKMNSKNETKFVVDLPGKH